MDSYERLRFLIEEYKRNNKAFKRWMEENELRGKMVGIKDKTMLPIVPSSATITPTPPIGFVGMQHPTILAPNGTLTQSWTTTAVATPMIIKGNQLLTIPYQLSFTLSPATTGAGTLQVGVSTDQANNQTGVLIYATGTSTAVFNNGSSLTNPTSYTIGSTIVIREDATGIYVGSSESSLVKITASYTLTGTNRYLFLLFPQSTTIQYGPTLTMVAAPP